MPNTAREHAVSKTSRPGEVLDRYPGSPANIVRLVIAPGIRCSAAFVWRGRVGG
jgi:hypothetical protein